MRIYLKSAAITKAIITTYSNSNDLQTIVAFPNRTVVPEIRLESLGGQQTLSARAVVSSVVDHPGFVDTMIKGHNCMHTRTWAKNRSPFSLKKQSTGVHVVLASEHLHHVPRVKLVSSAALLFLY